LLGKFLAAPALPGEAGHVLAPPGLFFGAFFLLALEAPLIALEHGQRERVQHVRHRVGGREVAAQGLRHRLEAVG